MATAEHPLPAQLNPGAAGKAEGFATPKQDKRPQCARFLPKRVLPVIFLPGIMGSNLRMSAQRQRKLRQKDNIAWRPDTLGATNINKNAKTPQMNANCGWIPCKPRSTSTIQPVRRTSAATDGMPTSNSTAASTPHC